MAKKKLTPAQKKFVEVMADAKKIQATGKYKKWTDCVKKAWANAK